jgi:hypothetical protein
MGRSKGKPGTAGAAASAPRTGQRAHGPDDRRELVRLAAYFLSERHGFDPSRDVENWLEAERQVDAALTSPAPRSRTRRKAEAQRTGA